MTSKKGEVTPSSSQASIHNFFEGGAKAVASKVTPSSGDCKHAEDKPQTNKHDSPTDSKGDGDAQALAADISISADGTYQAVSPDMRETTEEEAMEDSVDRLVSANGSCSPVAENPAEEEQDASSKASTRPKRKRASPNAAEKSKASKTRPEETLSGDVKIDATQAASDDAQDSSEQHTTAMDVSTNDDAIVDLSATSSSRGSPSKNVTAAAASTKKMRKTPSKKETAPTFEELPEETQTKIQDCDNEVERLLRSFEKEEESHEAGTDAEVDGALEAMVEMIKSADAYVADMTEKIASMAEENKKQESETDKKEQDEQQEPTPAESVPEIETPEERLERAIETIVARRVEGRTDPLSRLVVSTSNVLIRAQELVERIVIGTDTSEQVTEYHRIALCALESLQNTEEFVIDLIKKLTCRTPYGIKNEKGSDPYEDDAERCMWRWDIVDTTKYFSKTGQNISRELKASRKRHGTLLRALLRLREQLGKTLDIVPAKVDPLEKAVEKARVDLRAAEKRRLDQEVKRRALDEEKARKERENAMKKKVSHEEKERLKAQKSAEKADEARRREISKQEAAAEKAREREEKQLKKETEKEEKQQKKEAEKQAKKAEEAAKLAKNKSMMMGFFSAPKASPVRTSSLQEARAFPGIVAESPGASSQASAGAQFANPVDLTSSPRCGLDSFDTDAFLAKINSGMTREQCDADTGRISDLNSEQRVPIDLANCNPRPRIRLEVDRVAASTSFGEDGYVEKDEVFVDGYMRTFSFCDDHNRPGYYGTRSKTSGLISGRTPFERDYKEVNYDYDSDDDYEDCEGEDIGDSDGEEDEEGNDLEYNDFFRHDNDFGSDADSDGEVVAAVAMNCRQGKEMIGPRFLRDENGQWCTRLPTGSSEVTKDATAFRLHLGEEAGSTTLRAVTESEKDVQRLRTYGAICYASADAMPFLGWSEQQPHRDSEAKRREEEKKAAAEKAKAEKKAAAEAAKAEKKATEEAAKAEKKAAAEAAKAEKKAAAEAARAAKASVPKELDSSLLPALVKLIHGKKDGMDKLITEFRFMEGHEQEPHILVKRKLQQIAQKTKSEEGHGTARWVVFEKYIQEAGLSVGDAEGQVHPIAWTPRREKKRSRPESITTEAPKSARQRGDKSGLVKELGHEWWPDDKGEMKKEEADESTESQSDEMDVDAEHGGPATARSEGEVSHAAEASEAITESVDL